MIKQLDIYKTNPNKAKRRKDPFAAAWYNLSEEKTGLHTNNYILPPNPPDARHHTTWLVIPIAFSCIFQTSPLDINSKFDLTTLLLYILFFILLIKLKIVMPCNTFFFEGATFIRLDPTRAGTRWCCRIGGTDRCDPNASQLDRMVD